MPILKLHEFVGLNPSSADKEDQDNYATVAHNVDLSNGTLRPWRVAKPIAATTTNNGYLCGCDWVDIEPCEMASSVHERCDAVVVSGGDGVKITTCGGESCDLTLDAPAKPATAIAGVAAEDRDLIGRSYIYVYRTAWGVSSVSPVSNEVKVADGDATTVGGFDTSTNTCVTHIDVYRTATGYRSGTEEVQEQLTGFRFVAALDVGTTSFVDDVVDKNLGHALQDEAFATAPRNLKMVQGYNAGGLVGYEGRTLRSSIAGQPHRWPVEAIVTFPEKIQGILAVTTGTFVFGFSSIYFSNKYQPGTPCGQPVELRDVPTPVINHRHDAISRLGETVIYISDEGLVQTTPRDAQVLTRALFHRNDWRKLKLETMRIGVTRGDVKFSTDDINYNLNIGDNKTLTTFDGDITRYVKSGNNTLLLIDGGEVNQFDAGALNIKVKWGMILRSRAMRFRYANTVSSGTFDININTASTLVLNGVKKCKLTCYRKATRHKVIIETSSEVSQVTLTTSVRDKPQGTN